MSIKRDNLLHILWERSPLSALTLPPTLSAAEQTRLSWARRVESYEAVPEVFKDYFAAFQTGERTFPHAVLTPTYEGFLHRAAEKMVCAFDDAIHILERSGDAFETQCYPLAGISYVEARTILLDSRIRICGATRQGLPAASTLQFNSVTDYLFTPILEAIRFVAVGSRGAARREEQEKFDQWARLSFKFMNYARRSLLGDEKVIQAILQPEIRTRIFSILGRAYYRTVAPTLACILTDRELILIREERMRGGGKYGGSWLYIPLGKIAALALAEKGDDLLEFSVELPQNERLGFLFQAPVRQELNQVVERFKGWQSVARN